MIEEIAESEFKSFEDVRESGVTNMFDLNMVEDLSGVGKDKLKIIMKNYSSLKVKFS